jgi:hypothetical protein
LHSPSYLLVAVAIVFENSGEEIELLCQGILVTESFRSVYQGGEDRMIVGWMVMGKLV